MGSRNYLYLCVYQSLSFHYFLFQIKHVITSRALTKCATEWLAFPVQLGTPVVCNLCQLERRTVF